MEVLLLAGGKGTRLKPYTTILPKPLLPLGEKPIIEILLSKLRDQGFKKVYISVGYLSHLIKAYFNNGNKIGIRIEYLEEKIPLGTAGPISLLPQLKRPFLVLNGDLVTDLDFSDIYNYHLKENSLLTIGIHKLEYRLPLGFLEIKGSNIIVDYIEKPLKKYNMSMGIYVCDPKIINYTQKNQYLDFPELTKILISKKEKVIGYFNNAYWLDVGRPEEYEKALDLLNSKNDIKL